MKYTISVVIPTLNRPEHLDRTLRSILEQTKSPEEIVIVDQSDDNRTKDLLIERMPAIEMKKIVLKYIWVKERSISHARNLGMSAAAGEIVIFVDDDIALDKKYISEILRVYSDHPSAFGVQGCLVEKSPYWRGIGTKSILLNSIRKAFLMTHWEKDKQTLLPSGDEVGAYPLTKTIGAGVINAGVSSFKKEVAKHFHYDENLGGYSWGEDIDFSVHLTRYYPKSLYVTPFAIAIHDYALSSRPTNKQFCYIVTAYELYSFCKNIPPSPRNWMAYFWKCCGNIVLTSLGLHRRVNRVRLFYVLQSYLWALYHFGRLKSGGFDLYKELGERARVPYRTD